MSRADDFKEVIEDAIRRRDEFLAGRDSGTIPPEKLDEEMLAIVAPLIAVARPKSTIRGTDWRIVVVMLSRNHVLPGMLA